MKTSRDILYLTGIQQLNSLPPFALSKPSVETDVLLDFLHAYAGGRNLSGY